VAREEDTQRRMVRPRAEVRERDEGVHPYGRPDEGPVEIDPADARADAADRDVAVQEARRRFGGIDVPASLVGMLTALALLTLIGGLVGAAIGAIGYQTNLDNETTKLSIAGLAGGLVALFVSYFVGGWAAARIARYDGVRNGVLTGVWTLVLAAILAALGAALGSQYDVFSNVDLPNWFSRDALTLGAIISAVVAIVVMFLGGAAGGAIGARYHRRADAAVAASRPGRLAR
jgi:MFS family permease